MILRFRTRAVIRLNRTISETWNTEKRAVFQTERQKMSFLQLEGSK